MHDPDLTPQYVLTQTGNTITFVVTYSDEHAAMKQMRGWRHVLNTGLLKQLIDKETWWTP